MASHYSARALGEHMVYELDNRYGPSRTGFSSEELVMNMTRLDDRIEEADIKPGDRFEMLVERYRKSHEYRRMLCGLEWIPVPNAVFYAIDNGRVLVMDTRPGLEDQRYSAFSSLEDILDFRKVI